MTYSVTPSESLAAAQSDIRHLATRLTGSADLYSQKAEGLISQ
nr:hypothetical protein [Treponema denticola]